MSVRSTQGRLSTGHGCEGFTLIELLVVVAILGILAAIAIPSYTIYRKKAYDACAMHDLGNAVTAEEAYYASNFHYVPIASVTGPAVIDVPGFVVSEHVQLEVDADADSFGVTSTALTGTGVVYKYASETGVITKN